MNIGNEVCNNLNITDRDPLWISCYSSVLNLGRVAVDESVDESVWVAVNDSVRNSVSGSIRSSIRNNVADEIKEYEYRKGHK
jgi:hypothetical protein